MFLKNGLRKCSGMSLIEILIALAVNIMLLTALVAVLASYVGHYNTATNTDVLNQQLQTAMQIMASDIRRAGYWGNASSDINSGANNNPFMVSGSTDISASGSCILFTYDYDGNGSVPSVSSAIDDERYGYRLSGGALQSRPPGSAFACNAASSNWENMTNPSIVTITALTFTLNTYALPIGQAHPTITTRSVDISITGQLVADTSITKTITQHVRVRNDKYAP